MSDTNASSFSDLAPKDWNDVIKKMLTNEVVVVDTPTCIHKVPERLRVIKPEAYTPHYMGLGPYHHWRQDLYAMEPYKLIASLKSQHGCLKDKTPTEAVVCNCLNNDKVLQIRASYDRHLGVEDDPLALMMVIDGIFLLQFLQVIVPSSERQSYLTSSTRTSRLVDDTKSAYHCILQDIMMLENQIPIFVLEHILSLKLLEVPEHNLPEMLCSTCMKLSPFKLPNRNNLRRPTPTEYAHLLELLYYLIVPEEHNDDLSPQRRGDVGRVEELPSEEKESKRTGHIFDFPPPNPGDNINLINKFKPWKFINKMIKLINAVIPNLFSNKPHDLESGVSSNNSCEGNDKGAPKVDEIKIPSVKDLRRVGIKFCPLHENKSIEDIKFDKKSKKFYLPSITINDNTEVIIRNLVAYEAVGIHGRLVLARYTELMNGIIDTAEDVKLLRDSKIIVYNYLKKDEDVARLWNGMSRSIRLSSVPYMDEAIREVNKYYENHMRVKFIRFTKDCVFCGWKISMLLLTLLLLVLMAIQSFCDVYRCPSVLQPVTKPEP